MPVVITDHTNKTWATEQPNDGYIHVGYTGKSGPRLLDILDFIGNREKQFIKFVQKRNEQEGKKNAKKRRIISNPLRQDSELQSLSGGGAGSSLF